MWNVLMKFYILVLILAGIQLPHDQKHTPRTSYISILAFCNARAAPEDHLKDFIFWDFQLVGRLMSVSVRLMHERHYKKLRSSCLSFRSTLQWVH